MKVKEQAISNLMHNKEENVDKDYDKMSSIKNYIKLDYKTLQNAAINESIRQLMNVIMPLELNLFANKYLKFTDLTNFNNLDELYENILENEYT